ncbi:Copper binding protein, plastocyanin/azurin family [Polaromonas sp. CG9_12]|uniref:plastocyanin n=1 Tax=Polaromonas sp. CG_9.11 TaxID=2787730 RepID=UPI0004DDD5D0|nr:plastocyanin [Polaromonas sp. CG_9.11]MBG6076367.1 plastocyanin [Polaromonas sp. CG_9.11]CDS50503.1 Copper binding protein, plastocyanin/azurin family [Polaromonas sp. CG9_12]
MKKFLFSSAMLAACAGVMAGSLSVAVVDKEGQPVPDAIVLVFPSDKSALPKVPLPTQATIAQEKMQFLPNVTLVPVGARLSFINNDPWDHHVRSSPAGMGQFNATQAGFELRLEGKSAGKPSRPTEVTLAKAGALSATLLGCFIHGSMRGYVYVSETPWAAKTSAEGLAVFDDLPEGAAQVRVWQADQLVDLAPRPFNVSALPGKLSVQLGVVPRRRRS